jgi:hypothetical protein
MIANSYLCFNLIVSCRHRSPNETVQPCPSQLPLQLTSKSGSPTSNSKQQMLHRSRAVVYPPGSARREMGQAPCQLFWNRHCPRLTTVLQPPCNSTAVKACLMGLICMGRQLRSMMVCPSHAQKCEQRGTTHPYTVLDCLRK